MAVTTHPGRGDDTLTHAWRQQPGTDVARRVCDGVESINVEPALSNADRCYECLEATR